MAHPISCPQSAAVTVRDVRGPDELRACQDLQRRAWGITEDGYVLPVATMAAAQKVGGLVLGAFETEPEQLVGFAFAFLGQVQDRLVMYSQITGVDPAHQGKGIGRVLKLEQRRRAGELGLPAVVWAFDPLQANNAAFNLAVLGATCSSYEVDLYGPRSDSLNVGLATDRLFAEWPTAGEPRGRSSPWPDGVDLIESRAGADHEFALPAYRRDVPAGAVHLTIQVPPSIARLKAHGPPTAARDWQLACRAAFQAAFSSGFTAIGFSRADPHRPRYLLERTA